MKTVPHIRPLPFLKILPAAAAGILAADLTHIPLWLAILLGIVCLILAAATGRKRSIPSIFTYASILLFAVAMTAFTRPNSAIPKGEKLIMTICVTDAPVQAGRWTKSTVRICDYRTSNDMSGNAEWHKSDEKAVIRFDSSLSISPGERLIATGYATELGSAEYAGYVRFMQRRGYSCNVWIDGSQNIIMLPNKIHTPTVAAAKMQCAAAERLSRLVLPSAHLATAKAMSLGEKSGLQPSLKEDYRISGASHLLAVSGLHVGIAALLVNLLLGLVPAFRYGHLVKNTVAVGAIWLYAMLTGLSASAVRAAMMFTGAQMAFAASRTGNSANVMLATATVMLLINPNYLYDISFQLSFAAVAGIFTLYRPLYRTVRSRFKILNAFWTVFTVGLAAALATGPLVSYCFGRIPIIGIIINPVLILTANATVLLSLLWILLPLEFLNGFFSTAINFSVGLQNSLIGISADKGWAALPVRLELWQVITLYAAAAALYSLLIQRARTEKAALISDTL